MTDKSQNISQPKNYKLIVEKDVKIPMRDGAILYADVFRPDGGAERVPAIMNIGPYQKDRLWIPPEDLEEKANPHLAWETANPEWWCPRGYACVRVDARGSGKSPGTSDPSSHAEAVDFYDAIEWVAKLPWCSGSIGTLGVSYHANCQWRVANLQPPSFKAIIPWEGRADLYRDQTFHGGIFAIGFFHTWVATNMAHHLIGRARTYNPGAFNNNMLWTWASNSLDSEFWRMRSAKWDEINVPLMSVGNWTGVGLHLRGNVEGFVHAASKHKKLRIHSGTHFHPFHSEEGRRDQLRFFDHWLKGQDTGIMDEPPVKLMIRTGGENPANYKFRFENEWPLARTQWTKMYLERDCVGTERGCRARRRDRARRARQERDVHVRGEPADARRRELVRALARGRQQGSHGDLIQVRAVHRGHRDHRPDRARDVGVEHVGGHGHLRDDPQHRPRRKRRVGDRAAGARRGAGHEGLASRLAPQARPGTFAARTGRITRTPSGSGSSAARRSSVRSKSGRRAWCSGRDTGCSSTSSRETA